MLWLVVWATQRRVAKLERARGTLDRFLGEGAAPTLDQALSRIFELTGKVPIAVGSRHPRAEYVHWHAGNEWGVRWAYAIPWERFEAPDDAPVWRFQGEPLGTWHTLEQLEAAAGSRRRGSARGN